ncbi:MAG TPA: carboxylating nicotinate-nucleotide diphosphorylase [Saprospiraceae bacterium]|nr:carboxylating nicotinate-nucleotide diphosphorylase [Saprospiraceae bacterium]
MDQILDQQLDEFIERALREDVGEGDHTSLACIPSEARDTAYLLVKEAGVLAGVAFAQKVFQFVDPSAKMDILLDDGHDVKPGDIAFEVNCNAQALLKAERLVLNTMQRMTGIASISRQYAKEVKDYPTTILDTRKTTPLIRFLEKWAVRIGGSSNYRDGLYDWIMIKDNHIDACGSIPQAIRRVQAYLENNQLDLGITVEVRSLEEMNQVLEAGGITRIMLDNFDTPSMAKAVKLIDGRFEVEASGGITLERLKEIAEVGVDFISVGALTHSAKSVDLSLKIKC